MASVDHPVSFVARAHRFEMASVDHPVSFVAQAHRAELVCCVIIVSVRHSVQGVPTHSVCWRLSISLSNQEVSFVSHAHHFQARYQPSNRGIVAARAHLHRPDVTSST